MEKIRWSWREAGSREILFISSPLIWKWKEYIHSSDEEKREEKQALTGEESWEDEGMKEF